MILSTTFNPITFNQEGHYSGNGYFAIIGIFILMFTLIGSINILVKEGKPRVLRISIIISAVLICVGSFALTVFGFDTYLNEIHAVKTNNEKALTSWVNEQYGIKLTQAQAEELYYSSEPAQVTDSHGKLTLVQLRPVTDTDNTYILYSVGQPTPLNQK